MRDNIVGSAATAIGTAGMTYQFTVDALSLVVLIANAVVALGGIYLLYVRIRAARRIAED